VGEVEVRKALEIGAESAFIGGHQPAPRGADLGGSLQEAHEAENQFGGERASRGVGPVLDRVSCDEDAVAAFDEKGGLLLFRISEFEELGLVEGEVVVAKFLLDLGVLIAGSVG